MLRRIVRKVWFHQYGALTHVARQSMNFLSRIFSVAFVIVCPLLLFRTLPGRRHPQAFYCVNISGPKCVLLVPENLKGIATNNGALLQRVMQI